MIWLVIGIASRRRRAYGPTRDRPIIDVARSLDIGGGRSTTKDVTASAVVQARARLGKSRSSGCLRNQRRPGRIVAPAGIVSRTLRSTVLMGRIRIASAAERLSKTPDGEEQEIWGLLLACNLVRVAMERAAKLAKVPPLRISFITALRFIREEWFFDSLPGASPGAIPRHLKRLTEQLGRFILPERRSRSNPRVVKIKMSSYPKKKRKTQA